MELGKSLLELIPNPDEGRGLDVGADNSVKEPKIKEPHFGYEMELKVKDIINRIRTWFLELGTRGIFTDQVPWKNWLNISDYNIDIVKTSYKRQDGRDPEPPKQKHMILRSDNENRYKLGVTFIVWKDKRITG